MVISAMEKQLSKIRLFRGASVCVGGGLAGVSEGESLQNSTG